MPYTHKATVVAKYAVQYLEAYTPALADVFYGDSDYIPRVPTAAVEAGNKTRELVGAQFQTDVRFNIEFMVYTAKLTNEHDRQLEADELLEDLEDYINLERTMGDNVIHGFVASTEQGFALRNDNEVLRAARMTWTGLSRQRL